MATTTAGLWYPDGSTPISIIQMIKAAQESVQTVAGLGAWTSYTPVLAATTNPVLGTGGSAVGRYTKHGKVVTFSTSITFGTSGFTSGDGPWTVSLPTPSGGSSKFALAGWIIWQGHFATPFTAIIYPGGSIATEMRNSDRTQVSSTTYTPMTAATTIVLSGTYEGA